MKRQRESLIKPTRIKQKQFDNNNRGQKKYHMYAAEVNAYVYKYSFVLFVIEKRNGETFGQSKYH